MDGWMKMIAMHRCVNWYDDADAPFPSSEPGTHMETDEWKRGKGKKINIMRNKREVRKGG